MCRGENSKLSGNEFADFKKFLKTSSKFFESLRGVAAAFAVVEYYLQRSKPLLCKLFEDCALAQRSEASET